MTKRQQFIKVLVRRIKLKTYREYSFQERMAMTRGDFYARYNCDLLNDMSECDEIFKTDLYDYYLNITDKQWKRAVLEARRTAWKELY